MDREEVERGMMRGTKFEIPVERRIEVIL